MPSCEFVDTSSPPMRLYLKGWNIPCVICIYSDIRAALSTNVLWLCIGAKAQRNTFPQNDTVLVNTADADHAWDIRDCRSITSSIHLMNGVDIAWKCKKQAVATLHSTGSEITSLTSGVKKTNNLLDFLASLGYPVGAPTPTFEDNQGIIKAIRASRIYDNTRHLVTNVPWLNEQYTAGIIKLLYTKTMLQLSDCNTKPLRYVASLLKPCWLIS
jgi:hypothetical protein